MDFQRKPLVLIVLDGCGHSDDKQYNAVANATTPLWEELWKSNHPGTFIETSGLAVGLPEGQMGFRSGPYDHRCWKGDVSKFYPNQQSY